MDLDEHLIEAAKSGNLEEMKILLGKNADPDAGDNDGVTALMYACDSGNLKMVKLLIEKGADIEAEDDEGNTALIKACLNQYLEVIQYLIEHGADVDASVDTGDGYYAPLITEIATLGYADVIKILIENDVDIEAEDAVGKTALIKAAEDGHIEVVKLMKKAGAKYETAAFTEACLNQHLEVVKYFIENAADVNVSANNMEGGHSPLLIEVATWGYVDVIKILLENGVNIEAEDDEGKTALVKATEYGHMEIVKLLKKAGAIDKLKDLGLYSSHVHKEKESKNMLISKFDTTNVEVLIKEFEAKYNFNFPAQYKKFLLKYNGGETPETTFDLNRVSSDLRAIYGFGNANVHYNYKSLEDVWSFKDWIRDEMLPIGCNVCGDDIMLGIGKKNSGKIYFYYHDRPKKYRELAEDFKSFVGKCKSEKIDHISPVEERKQGILASFCNLFKDSRVTHKPPSIIHQEELILD